MPGFNQMNGAYNEQQGISWSTIAGYTLAGIGIAGGLRMAGRSAGKALGKVGSAIGDAAKAGRRGWEAGADYGMSTELRSTMTNSAKGVLNTGKKNPYATMRRGKSLDSINPVMPGKPGISSRQTRTNIKERMKGEEEAAAAKGLWERDDRLAVMDSYMARMNSHGPSGTLGEIRKAQHGANAARRRAERAFAPDYDEKIGGSWGYSNVSKANDDISSFNDMASRFTGADRERLMLNRPQAMRYDRRGAGFTGMGPSSGGRANWQSQRASARASERASRAQNAMAIGARQSAPGYQMKPGELPGFEADSAGKIFGVRY